MGEGRVGATAVADAPTSEPIEAPVPPPVAPLRDAPTSPMRDAHGGGIEGGEGADRLQNACRLERQEPPPSYFLSMVAPPAVAPNPLQIPCRGRALAPPEAAVGA